MAAPAPPLNLDAGRDRGDAASARRLRVKPLLTDHLRSRPHSFF